MKHSRLEDKQYCSEFERLEDKLQNVKVTASHNNLSSNQICAFKNRKDPVILNKNRCAGQIKPYSSHRPIGAF